MPPKAVPITTLGASTLQDDTSIEDDSSQSQLVTIDRLKEVIKRININNIGLKAKIKDIRTIKAKILLIERFDGVRNKLKGFLTQMRIKILYKGAKLPILLDQVAYAGLFLTGRALEWFKPYLIEIQENSIITTNKKVQYIFATQDRFIE